MDVNSCCYMWWSNLAEAIRSLPSDSPPAAIVQSKRVSGVAQYRCLRRKPLKLIHNDSSKNRNLVISSVETLNPNSLEPTLRSPSFLSSSLFVFLSPLAPSGVPQSLDDDHCLHLSLSQ
jgi:hypothetical protein